MSQYIYLNRDNEIVLELRSNDVLVDLTALTQVIFKLAAKDCNTTVTLASSAASASFDWTGTTYGDGTLIMSLGTQVIAAGYYNGTLIIYDTTYQNGLVWGEQFPVIVKDGI
jgi:hypothetical protein